MADCETCDDTGSICDGCGEADGECICKDGPDLVDCPDCGEDDPGFYDAVEGDDSDDVDTDDDDDDDFDSE